MSAPAVSGVEPRRAPSAVPHPAAAPGTAEPTPDLLLALAAAFARAGVVACQWKGQWKRARWASGAGDVDLLLERAARGAAVRELEALGFKAGLVPPGDDVAGLEHYFGWDRGTGRILHVHLHYRLVFGNPAGTAWRLPLERVVLDGAVFGDPFPVPAPELALLILVVTTVLRGGPSAFRAASPELRTLRKLAPAARVVAGVERHLPDVPWELFARCADAVLDGAGALTRFRLRRALARALRASAMRPAPGQLVGRAARALVTLRGRLFRRRRRTRLAAGGVVFALLGGDGAGKSTCARALIRWLDPRLPVLHAHLGRPPRSVTTLLVGGLLKVRNLFARRRATGAVPPFPGYLALWRALCTARDRYRLYVRARRVAAQGGIAVCERFPVAQNRALVGPAIPALLPPGPARPLAARLAEREARIYRRIAAPDAMAVLLLDPELAVARKTDEPAAYVRRRAAAIRDADWSGTGARLVDAARPFPAVFADVQAALWEAL